MTGPSISSLRLELRTGFNPAQLNRMDTGRLAAYRSNLDFYRGNHWPNQSRHRQLVFNYTRVAIDKVTSFLMPGLNFACYPVTDAAGDKEAIKVKIRRAEQLLRQVYEENNLRQLDYETEIDAAVLGDGCYKVIWDTEKKRIRVTAPDVSGIYAWWLGDDTSRVWRVASRYTLTQDEVEMLYPDVIASGAWQSHPILSGEYREESHVSRARAIGRNTGGNHILEEALDWDLLPLAIDILEQDYDPNLQTAARAQERADAILRQLSLRAERGNLVVPTNVGQELLDVITVTDQRCGISENSYRVNAIQTDYDRRKGIYTQRLMLCAP